MARSDPSPTFNRTLSSRCTSEVPLKVATPALPNVIPEPTVRLLLNDPVVPVTAPVRGPTNPAAVATPAVPTEYATPTASCPPDTLTQHAQ